MSYSPKQPCSTPGCSSVVLSGQCAACKAATSKDGWAERRGSSHARGYGATWRKLRELVLHRDPICQTPGCGRFATDVDHVVPKARGGDDSMGNLQGLCKACHTKKTAMQDRPISSRRYVVWGPPCSGKTTHVRESRKPGDIVVDYDAIHEAIVPDGRQVAPHDISYVMDAQNAVLRRLVNDSFRPCWVILATPDRDKVDALARRLNAKIIQMSTPKDVCLARLDVSRERANIKAQQMTAIADWFARNPCDVTSAKPSNVK